jgi:hypothetical protein
MSLSNLLLSISSTTLNSPNPLCSLQPTQISPVRSPVIIHQPRSTTSSKSNNSSSSSSSLESTASSNNSACPSAGNVSGIQNLSNSSLYQGSITSSLGSSSPKYNPMYHLSARTLDDEQVTESHEFTGSLPVPSPPTLFSREPGHIYGPTTGRTVGCPISTSTPVIRPPGCLSGSTPGQDLGCTNTGMYNSLPGQTPPQDVLPTLASSNRAKTSRVKLTPTETPPQEELSWYAGTSANPEVDIDKGIGIKLFASPKQAPAVEYKITNSEDAQSDLEAPDDVVSNSWGVHSPKRPLHDSNRVKSARLHSSVEKYNLSDSWDQPSPHKPRLGESRDNHPTPHLPQYPDPKQVMLDESGTINTWEWDNSLRKFNEETTRPAKHWAPSSPAKPSQGMTLPNQPTPHLPPDPDPTRYPWTRVWSRVKQTNRGMCTNKVCTSRGWVYWSISWQSPTIT